MLTRHRTLRLFSLVVATLVASCAYAGGGPENVLLVVNSNSLNSKTIANHYIALRKIPPTNIVYVDWRGGIEAAQGKYFSQSILQPAIDAIGQRGSQRRSTTWCILVTFLGRSGSLR